MGSHEPRCHPQRTLIRSHRLRTKQHHLIKNPKLLDSPMKGKLLRPVFFLGGLLGNRAPCWIFFRFVSIISLTLFMVYSTPLFHVTGCEQNKLIGMTYDHQFCGGSTGHCLDLYSIDYIVPWKVAGKTANTCNNHPPEVVHRSTTKIKFAHLLVYVYRKDQGSRTCCSFGLNYGKLTLSKFPPQISGSPLRNSSGWGQRVAFFWG